MFRLGGGQSITSDSITGFASSRGKSDDVSLADERILDEVFNRFACGAEASVLKLSRLSNISRSLILSYSQGIIDALPKLGSTAGSRMEEVDQLLRSKRKRHSQFLEFMAALCAQSSQVDFTTIRTLIDNDERLEATIALRSFLNSSKRHWVEPCVDHVGFLMAEKKHALRSLTSFPVTVATVSGIDECFLYFDAYCVEHADSSIGEVPVEGKGHGHVVLEFARAWIAVLEGLKIYKGRWRKSPAYNQLTFLSEEVKACTWISCSAPILRCIARHVQRLATFLDTDSHFRSRTTSTEWAEYLAGFITLTEHLLDLYAHSSRANSTHGAVWQEYIAFKKEFIETMARHGMQDSSSRNGAINTALQLSVRHHEYGTLLALCEFTGDAATLRSSMHADENFRTYVFRTYHSRQCISDLIGFADDFETELLEYLEQFPEVKWMLQARLNLFSSAAETLVKIDPVSPHCNALAVLSQMACSTRSDQ